MNKRLDLTKLGGYPLTQKDLDWMQVSYRGAFAAMSAMIGDNVIIAGMQEAAGSVTAGWVSIAGELVPFLAGVIGDGSFIIDETSTTLVFEDGNSKLVRYERVARFSSGGAYHYSSLNRIGTLKDLFTAGMIIMWSGAVDAVPQGWALCDGTDGAPNLKGQFVVGYNAGDIDYNAIGKTGGETRHILTIPEMPSHNHTEIGPGNIGDHAGGSAGYDRPNGTQINNTGSSGGGIAHENRPPFYTLAYIIKK